MDFLLHLFNELHLNYNLFFDDHRLARHFDLFLNDYRLIDSLALHFDFSFHHDGLNHRPVNLDDSFDFDDVDHGFARYRNFPVDHNGLNNPALDLDDFLDFYGVDDGFGPAARHSRC